MPEAAERKLQVPWEEAGAQVTSHKTPQSFCQSGLLCEMRKIFFLLLALLLLKSVKYYSGQASGLCAPQGGLMEVSQADRVYQFTATDRESFFISPPALLQMRALSGLWVLPEHHRSQQYSLIHQGNAPEKIFFKKLSIVS